jgi:hypothetical protein
MADTHPTTPTTGSLNSIIIADRRLLILRLLATGGPFNIKTLCAAVGEIGHAPDRQTIMGDLAALEYGGKVKLTDDRLMVEAVTTASCANAQPPVPFLTETNERQCAEDREWGRDEQRGSNVV